MNDGLYAKMFASRAVLSFFVVMLLLMTCILRTAVIATSDYTVGATSQSLRKINISRLRGTIYDCNMVPITNNDIDTIAAVLPTPKGVVAIKQCVDDDTLLDVTEKLKNGEPTVCHINNTVNSEGIAFSAVYRQSDEPLLACHLIGYTDSTGHGVSGIQKAYDDFLYSEKFASAVFTVGGTDEILSGIDPYFENDVSVVKSGVVTTIDINIQSITENALKNMNSGCAIVCEAATGKIRAMASVPTFDIKNISESLTGDNSPMLNRALSTFNVGSVFKPGVAMTALESGYVNHSFNCEGSTKIIDRIFRCHKLDGHGFTNMCTALSQSCNCYFYNLAITLGSEKIYKTVANLSICNKIRIADNLYAFAGNIPEEKSLENDGALANLSIGQGSLLASPVAMLNLYNAIAGDGCYFLPSVVEKTVKDGEQEYYDFGKKTRIMKVGTAERLREYLKTVITEGTGTEASPMRTTAGGKTATAQTGRYYDDGVEITNSWFCGFFPAECPKYVVIVMSDNRLNVSTASIFAQIADGITLLESKNVENTD